MKYLLGSKSLAYIKSFNVYIFLWDIILQIRKGKYREILSQGHIDHTSGMKGIRLELI